MVQSNGNPSKGDGQQDYKSEVKFEHLGADVFFEYDAEGNKEITYAKDVIEALEDDSLESDSNGDND